MESDPISEPKPGQEQTRPQVHALYRPQMFARPHLFLTRPRTKRRKMVIVGVALLVVATGLALFQFVSERMATDAVTSTADSFIQAEFSGDSKKAMAHVDPAKIKTQNIQALAMIVRPSLKGQPERLDQDIQKQDGQNRAVGVYKFMITDPQAPKNSSPVPVYIILLLQKDQGKWRVKAQSMSAVEPKADVTSYTDRF